eukprot:365002-Chlamydomonas_euryale.AAC.1
MTPHLQVHVHQPHQALQVGCGVGGPLVGRMLRASRTSPPSSAAASSTAFAAVVIVVAPRRTRPQHRAQRREADRRHAHGAAAAAAAVAATANANAGGRHDAGPTSARCRAVGPHSLVDVPQALAPALACG